MYKLGYDLAARDYSWAKAPPGFTAPVGTSAQPAAQN
jgi:hypothetical protein